ncbi:hypothetical protein LCGC14_0467460 [marine sediment metagenome]|uniref:Uncharacterized protein n=1 Tax=marine sediment metagenome TaxID=412755 RepID=A0A0F9VM91_9ZZZZ
MRVKKIPKTSRLYQRYAKGSEVLYHATGKDKLGYKVNIVGTKAFIDKTTNHGGGHE